MIRLIAWYCVSMVAKLSQELSEALHASGHRQLEVVDPQTQRVYVLCDREMHQHVKRVLDREAIAEGVRQMESGETQSLNEAFEEMRIELGFDKRQ